MYNGYVDPYKTPSNVEITRFNSVLRNKILGTERKRKHLENNSLKNMNSEENDKMVELFKDDLFEYIPM